jgi:YD repeat-containing protein
VSHLPHVDGWEDSLNIWKSLELWELEQADKERGVIRLRLENESGATREITLHFDPLGKRTRQEFIQLDTKGKTTETTTTTYKYDEHGRLTEIDQKSNAEGATHTTEHFYQDEAVYKHVTDKS